MALLEVTAEQILNLIQQLPTVSKQIIFDALRQEFESVHSSDIIPTVDADTQTWLEAELTEPVPAYDWGVEGVPKGLPVQYVPGQGVIITKADES